MTHAEISAISGCTARTGLTHAHHNDACAQTVATV